MTDAAELGQSEGMNFLNAAPIPSDSGGGTSFTYQDGTTGTLGSQDMLPAQAATPEQQNEFTAIEQSYMDDVSLGNITDAFAPDIGTTQGQAYGVINSSSKPDLQNDPIWQTSDNVMANIDAYQAEFADCSLTNTLVDSSRTERLPDMRYCEVMNVPLDTCTVYHDYSGVPPYSPAAVDVSSEVIVPNDPRITRSPCGYGCVDFTFTPDARGEYNLTQLFSVLGASPITKYGRTGDVIYNVAPAYNVVVLRPDLIQSATLFSYTYTMDKWVLVGARSTDATPLLSQKSFAYAYSPSGVNLLTSSNIVNWFYEMAIYPPVTEVMTNKIGNYGNNTDFTAVHKLQGNASRPVTVEYFSETWWWLERSSFTMRYRFSTEGLTVPPPLTEQWYPQECIDTLNAAASAQYCTQAEAICVEQTTTGSYTDPATGIVYNESDLAPSPLPGVNNLCKRAQITTRCPINEGQMDCYIDANGVQRCPQNDSSVNNACVQYENDPQCAYIGETCMDNIIDPNTGNCMIFERQYDCGYDVEITTQATQTTYDCPGPVRCFGEECIFNTMETNTDFVKVAATIDAVKYMAMDMECGVGPGDAGDNCMVFTGTPAECKKAVGGVQNCCKSPGTTSMPDYLKLMYAIYETDKAAEALKGDSAIAGAWVALSDPVKQLWSTISEGASSLWTSAMESIVGGGTAGADLAAASVADQATQDAVKASMADQITTNVATWVENTFGRDVSALLFDVTYDSTGQNVVSANFGGTIGNAANTVMTAYMYYQAAVVLIQLAYECEASEFELNAKRELKSTSYIGSYCRKDSLFGCIEKRQVYCQFNSPLARIINEQATPLLGQTYGTPRAPQCNGITLNQLATLDWSQIDLTKWEAILQESGIIPDVNDLTMDAITGSGNPINPTGDRQNTLDRTVDRLNATAPDPQTARQNVRQDILGQ